MNESDTRKAKGVLRSLKSRKKASRYKVKLDRGLAQVPTESANLSGVSTLAVRPDIEMLRALVEDMQDEGAVFQSVAVAALQILERVLRYERKAAAAALSLGQQEKLQTMVATVEEAYNTLQGTLSAQGAKVKDLCAEQHRDDQPAERSWWFTLTDALEVLEKGTEQMTSLTSAQPEGSPAHALSKAIAQLLNAHHDELLVEAEQWIA